MPFGLTDKQIAGIEEVLSGFSDINEVVIYGSRAMGNFKPGSDVDLVLKGKVDEMTADRISRLLNDETNLPYIFDVAVFDTISNEQLRDHIRQFGKIFYRKGP